MKVCLLFPGQGAQYTGMLEELIPKYSSVNDILLEANDVLGFDLKKMILEGDMLELTHSANAQPAVVTASYALYSVFSQECNLAPVCGVGHSLGEISALTAAGGISFEDALCFARRRGEIMHRAYEEKRGRTALIMDISQDIVESEVRHINEQFGYVTVSCYNAPRQFVVAGEEKALKELDKRITRMKGDFVPFSMMPMKVDAPFHSNLMKFILSDMESEIEKIRPNDLDWDVISTVTGKAYESSMEIKNILGIQLSNPVLWNQALNEAETRGMDLYIDIGPQSFINNLTIENLKGSPCLAFDHAEDHEKILQFSLSAQSVNV